MAAAQAAQLTALNALHDAAKLGACFNDPLHYAIAVVCNDTCTPNQAAHALAAATRSLANCKWTMP